MDIVCPECGQGHEVPQKRIPANKFKASCRGCQVQFVVRLDACGSCGGFIAKGEACPRCVPEIDVVEEVLELDVPLEVEPGQVFEVPDVPVTSAPARGQKASSHTVQFSGTGAAFFRIWIVNLFLTIVTLGIYTPWAKVRTRQYFYNHTTIDGEPFEYLADPLILLRGYLIIGVGFLLYSFSQVIPVLSGLILLVFYVVFPWLVFRSLRFFAHNSSFKNIRFHFHGSLGEAYTTYLALPFAIGFSLGLIIPYWVYYKKRYFFENFAFGATYNTFTAKAKPFYGIYFKALLMMLVPLCVLGVLAALIFPQLQGMSGNEWGDEFSFLIVGLVFLVYLLLILASTFIQQYIYAKTTNYCWAESDLGSVRFESTLLPSKLMLIQAVNILAIIMSVGLLYPWAKIRRTRYIFENLTLHVNGDMDDFMAANTGHEEAIGEAAMDFFDFEIGL